MLAAFAPNAYAKKTAPMKNRTIRTAMHAVIERKSAADFERMCGQVRQFLSSSPSRHSRHGLHASLNPLMKLSVSSPIAMRIVSHI